MVPEPDRPSIRARVRIPFARPLNNSARTKYIYIYINTHEYAYRARGVNPCEGVCTGYRQRLITREIHRRGGGGERDVGTTWGKMTRFFFFFKFNTDVDPSRVYTENRTANTGRRRQYPNPWGLTILWVGIPSSACLPTGISGARKRGHTSES